MRNISGLLAHARALTTDPRHRPIYENGLKEPIRNLLFGDLLSLILIQVHKAKVAKRVLLMRHPRMADYVLGFGWWGVAQVDVAKAMLALDKLMRANGRKGRVPQTDD